MKKMLITTFLVLVLFAAVPAQAQQEYYPAELAYYDAQVNIMLPRLELYQAQYFYANGIYFQSLISHSTAPDAPLPPDGLGNSPTDQDQNLAYFWNVFAALPSQLAWSFSIDTYAGDSGAGYVLNVLTVIDGSLWMRSINYGPENWRGSEWHMLVVEE